MFIGYWESFISNECAKKLGLTIRDSSDSISCLGSFNTVSNGVVDLIFTSHFESDLQISTSAFVIEKVTDKIPHVSLPANICYKFNDLRLADPLFHKSANIDILLGVNVFFEFNQRRNHPARPKSSVRYEYKIRLDHFRYNKSRISKFESSGRESLECKYR
ncbi:retrovirus-related Pol polyprotein from transposon 17.6 [Trichonephila clavata]|uniref:Retrovirus-related Pol polyprotein from transposon 17.6 n=1 Tax=Trichonephila clavata TaxID=2740835 RepID=A0A8X6JJQ3_TRICU|nr:retrovirus-related Pol polyprotein from transposon 17.6 [Trichonephila clavata]